MHNEQIVSHLVLEPELREIDDSLFNTKSEIMRKHIEEVETDWARREELTHWKISSMIIAAIGISTLISCCMKFRIFKCIRTIYHFIRRNRAIEPEVGDDFNMVSEREFNLALEDAPNNGRAAENAEN